MLDLKDLRQDAERYRAALAKRGDHAAQIERLLDLDAQARAAQAECESLRAKRNEVSKAFSKARAAGEDIAALQAQAEEVKARLGETEGREKALIDERQGLLAALPNLPHESAPVGGEDVNRELPDRAWGEPRPKADWPFEPKAHWDLGEALGIYSAELGASLAGSGFSVLKGAGARLERALINFMLDLHARRGYTEVWPPALARREVLFGTGQIPKLEDDMYRLERDDLFLIPTAEVQLVNLHRGGKPLPEDALPIQYAAFTSCFRREAGAAGSMTRGLLRMHQFDKVELVRITAPERSAEAFEELLDDACEVLRQLELPYRVLELATGDMSFASHRTFDLEVYAAGVDQWLEVSSVSNCLDFQARRAGIRYKPAAGGKPQFVHTLNGSGTALPRVVVGILENNQREDGTIEVPEALRPYVGCELLEMKA